MTKNRYVFVTNNTTWVAQTIADIYKSRWQIELFFKWIKQHLKVKRFVGRSKNAVMTQLWVAMCMYLLLAYLKCLRLAGRGEKIHEKVCRCGGRVPIREVCRARSTTATTRADLGVSGTLGTCGASNASNETRRS